MAVNGKHDAGAKDKKAGALGGDEKAPLPSLMRILNLRPDIRWRLLLGFLSTAPAIKCVAQARSLWNQRCCIPGLLDRAGQDHPDFLRSTSTKRGSANRIVGCRDYS